MDHSKLFHYQVQSMIYIKTYDMEGEMKSKIDMYLLTVDQTLMDQWIFIFLDKFFLFARLSLL